MYSIEELVFLKPWAIREDLLAKIVEIVHRHVNGGKLSIQEIQARTGSEKKDRKPYEVVNGVAHIYIQGIISKHMSMVHDISQPIGISIDEIRKDFKAALTDSEVEKILLDIDSPGGSVDGIADLSDLIYSSRKQKPIIALANGQMDSAAYWIGSAAGSLYATQSAEVGSIGIYAIMHDISVFEHNAGIKTTIVKAGKYKAVGHPSQPLSQEDKDIVQQEVDAHYDLFVQAVQRNRNMSSDAVRKIADGRVWVGSNAHSMNLVDGIRSIDYFPEVAEAFHINRSKNDSAPASRVGVDSPGKTSKLHMDRASEYQKEHRCSFKEALDVTAEK